VCVSPGGERGRIISEKGMVSILVRKCICKAYHYVRIGISNWLDTSLGAEGMGD